MGGKSMKKYVVRYFYCRRKGSRNSQQFFIYPKPYAGLISEKEYLKFKKMATFMCSTRYSDKDKFFRVRCFIFSINEATEHDLKTYKDIQKPKFIQPLPGQVEALNKFKKEKFGIG